MEGKPGKRVVRGRRGIYCEQSQTTIHEMGYTIDELRKQIDLKSAYEFGILRHCFVV